MKPVNYFFKFPIAVCAAFFMMAILLLSSCANKMSFGVSSVVPAARGSVKIKTDKNKNYAIEVNVTHLAEPSRLTPPSHAYVVWMETNEGIKNIGQLRTSSGLLSRTMKANLKTVTTFKPDNFFITAEENGSVTMPGFRVILRTN
jgi:hypothetical protein